MTTAALVAALVSIPMQRSFSDELTPVDNPPQDTALALCVVACVGMAVAGIYIIARRCQPKYYWLMDDDQPPKFWVATATKKECQINGWHRIGGPYESPNDAPAIHPPSTNRVQSLVSPPLNVKVQATQDMQHWTVVNEQVGDLEDFSYSPTNAAFFRLEVSVP